MQDKQPNAGDERAAHDAPIEAISADRLADVLRRAGYRVTAAEQNGTVQLMSASQGIGFAVRFGNPATALAPQGADAQAAALPYIDYTLSCVLQVQGELPAELVADWNRTKRFARLASHGQFLALEMDVVVAGGVSERYLRSTIELWDRLIQEFLLHLRNRPAMAEQEAAARATAGGQAAVPAEVRAATTAATTATPEAAAQP
ncbi:YbjN domain-containing protein [Burkholderia pyrrocinia]|uniref:YbjN domain-containing protein n=1 Tax=Burkholderia pyrrocinia TaxID=60550 RepID=A0ABZ3BTH9_BURPY